MANIPAYLIPFRLKKLDFFEASSVQIGDKAFYVLKPSETVVDITARNNRTLMAQIQEYLKNGLNSVTNNFEHDSCEPLNIANARDMSATICDENSNKDERASDDVGEININNKGDGDHVNEVKGACQNNAANSGSEYEYEADASQSDAGSTASSHSSLSNPSKKKKCKKGLHTQSKLWKMHKVKKTKKKTKTAAMEDHLCLEPGNTLPVEILSTMSFVEVMWQVW